MKKYLQILGVSMFTMAIFMSCETPTWKQRCFQSEQDFNQHINDSIAYQKWIHDDSKFISTWTKSKTGGFEPYDYEQTFELNIMANGYGKLIETQYSPSKGYTTFRDESSLTWEKVNNESIIIKNLTGKWDPYDGEYRFSRFNGTYEISYESSSRITNTKTGHSFSNR
jgi:hypothetical protein